jgi:hypothetical protein
MMTSGSDASRQAADHARDGAATLSGATTGGKMFGGFSAASAFAELVGAAHTDHVTMLQGHHESLGNLAGKAEAVAAAFTETEDTNASALRAIRCSSNT